VRNLAVLIIINVSCLQITTGFAALFVMGSQNKAARGNMSILIARLRINNCIKK
jgi:hypothetical protein